MLCPLLTDVLDDCRGNGHAQVDYAPTGPVSFLSGPIEEGETCGIGAFGWEVTDQVAKGWSGKKGEGAVRVPVFA